MGILRFGLLAWPPMAQQIDHRMLDPLGISLVAQNRGHRLCEFLVPVDLPNEQHSAIGGQASSLEIE